MAKGSLVSPSAVHQIHERHSHSLYTLSLAREKCSFFERGFVPPALASLTDMLMRGEVTKRSVSPPSEVRSRGSTALGMEGIKKLGLSRPLKASYS